MSWQSYIKEIWQSKIKDKNWVLKYISQFCTSILSIYTHFLCLSSYHVFILPGDLCSCSDCWGSRLLPHLTSSSSVTPLPSSLVKVFPFLSTPHNEEWERQNNKPENLGVAWNGKRVWGVVQSGNNMWALARQAQGPGRVCDRSCCFSFRFSWEHYTQILEAIAIDDSCRLEFFLSFVSQNIDTASLLPGMELRRWWQVQDWGIHGRSHTHCHPNHSTSCHISVSHKESPHMASSSDSEVRWHFRALVESAVLLGLLLKRGQNWEAYEAAHDFLHGLFLLRGWPVLL